MKLWDYRCSICHKIEEFFLTDGDPVPVCCEQPMVKVPGGAYRKDFAQEIRERRNDQQLVDDPLTKFCVEEGLRRRRDRLAGTGRL